MANARSGLQIDVVPGRWAAYMALGDGAQAPGAAPALLSFLLPSSATAAPRSHAPMHQSLGLTMRRAPPKNACDALVIELTRFENVLGPSFQPEQDGACLDALCC